jgi:hypothetical protein
MRLVLRDEELSQGVSRTNHTKKLLREFGKDTGMSGPKIPSANFQPDTKYDLVT